MRSIDRAANLIPVMVNISFKLLFCEETFGKHPVALVADLAEALLRRSANLLVNRCAKKWRSPAGPRLAAG
jgi:hypothetical protein